MRPQIINQIDVEHVPDIDSTRPFLLWRWTDSMDWDDFPDLETTDKAVLIQEMLVPKEQRGQGEGTKLLTVFIKRYGQTNTILGQAYPFDPDSRVCVRPWDKGFKEKRRRLVRWYGTFGFVHVDAGWLYRLPTKKRRNDETRKPSSPCTRDDFQSRVLDARSHH